AVALSIISVEIIARNNRMPVSPVAAEMVDHSMTKIIAQLHRAGEGVERSPSRAAGKWRGPNAAARYLTATCAHGPDIALQHLASGWTAAGPQTSSRGSGGQRLSTLPGVAYNGSRAITVAVFRQPDANTVDVVKGETI